MADRLANEDIRPICRLSLAARFAQEVQNWLPGDSNCAADRLSILRGNFYFPAPFPKEEIMC